MESVSSRVSLVETLSTVWEGMVQDPLYDDGHLQMYSKRRSNADRGFLAVQVFPPTCLIVLRQTPSN